MLESEYLRQVHCNEPQQNLSINQRVRFFLSFQTVFMYPLIFILDTAFLPANLILSLISVSFVGANLTENKIYFLDDFTSFLVKNWRKIETRYF